MLFWTPPVIAYRVPDTGQTRCYDDKGNEIKPCPKPGESFYGQDANYTIHPMSFTKLDKSRNDLPDNADKWTMVRDNNTGLIWEVKADERSLQENNWKDALKVPEKLNAEKFGGRSDWRLPTMQELQSVLDYGKTNPAINTNYFPHTSSFHWTSDNKNNPTEETEEAWSVDISFGYVNSDYKHIYKYVICVSGCQAQSSGDLIANQDGTVTDKETGLIWQQDEAGQMKWKEALNYCENLTLAGKNDWRLPTIKELVSIVRLDKYKPATDVQHFPKTALDGYWSSSHGDNPKSAWTVYFRHGNVKYSYKHKKKYVRCVGGGRFVP